MSAVRVVALERGHDGVAIREPGEEFHIDEKRLVDGSTWFAPADSDAYAKVEALKKAQAAASKKQPPGAGPKAGSKVKEQTEPGTATKANDNADLA